MSDLSNSPLPIAFLLSSTAQRFWLQ